MRWAIGSVISVYVWAVWEIPIKIATWVQPIWSPSVGVSALMKPSGKQKKGKGKKQGKSKQSEQLLRGEKNNFASFLKHWEKHTAISY